MTLITAFRQQVTATAREGCGVFATVMNNAWDYSQHNVWKLGFTLVYKPYSSCM